MRPTKLNAILGVVLGVIGISKADAGCVGGEQIAAGNYTVGISGKQTSGSNEELIGMLTSDGKCSLNMLLQGKINAEFVIAASATGTYSVNTDHKGTLTLSIDGQPSQRFLIAIVGEGGTFTGIATDGGATARFDAWKGSRAIPDEPAISSGHDSNPANAQAATNAPPLVDHTPDRSPPATVVPTAKSPSDASTQRGNQANAQPVTNPPPPVAHEPDRMPPAVVAPTAKSPDDTASTHDDNPASAPAVANASSPVEHTPDHALPAAGAPTAESSNDASQHDGNPVNAQAAVTNAPLPVGPAPDGAPPTAAAPTAKSPNDASQHDGNPVNTKAAASASSPPVDHAPPVAVAPTAAAAANSSATRIVSADPASLLAEKQEESSGGDVEATVLVSRGDAVFGTGDLTTARAFYQRGADEGDGTAALRLGETFDPKFLQEAGLGRVVGDSKQALYWYRRAHDLGNRDADVVLESIDPPR
jgi:hypothetical protein